MPKPSYIHLHRYCFFLCTLFFSFYAQGQLTADFSADTVKGCAPLVVQFTDLSQGNPTTWNWDLGNGNVATGQNPGAIYFSTGRYTVKLVISDGSGTSTITKEQYIIVSEQPVVDFSADNTTGCLPLRMQFSDKSDGGSASITNWEWDFGDGETSLSQSPLHTYTTAGDETVTLKVTNSSGCAQVITKNNFAHALATPRATYSQKISSGCALPVTVNFTNTTTGGTNLTYRWNFGDGGTSTQANPAYTFNTAGNVNVKLIALNELGCSDTLLKPTVINSVKADFTVPAKICTGAASTFVNNSVPSVFSSKWSFSDNTTSSDTNAVKSFSSPGTYDVKLVNNFGNCIDSVTKSITVLPKPTVDFSIDAPASSCTVPVHATFKSNAAGAVSYSWTFGDNGSSVVANPVYDYTTYGIYSVKLEVTDGNGCSDSVTKSKAISIVAASIDSIKGLPYSGCFPRTQPFAARITTPEAITSYLWDFGDGTTSTTDSTTHTYAAAGAYNISLQIATASGCRDTLMLKNGVVLSAKPVADFSASTTITCASDAVKFKDLSSGTVTKWTWKFGDKGVGSGANPSFAFQDTGYFNVTLIAGNRGCNDTLIKPALIYVNPPIAKFTITNNCASPLNKKFNNKSIGAETSFWEFGDGSTSTENSPVYGYAAEGKYKVRLTVTNGSCTDTYVDSVTVINEHPDFSVSTHLNCKNLPIEFKAINLDTNNIKTYTWTFGDSIKLSRKFSTIIHAYTKNGFFRTALSVIDKLGCVQTIRHNDSINIFGPVAGLVSSKGNCENTLTTFTDSSKASANYPINKWEISYGDGSKEVSAKPFFEHTYSTAGKYNAGLIVTDSYGCTDTSQNKNTVTITSTKAAFTVNDTISCGNTAVQFTGSSNSDSLIYQWAFGDGASGTGGAPSHLYAAPGYYDVTLMVTDTVGCADTVTNRNAVLVANPSASFTVNDSVFPCPPAQANFAGNTAYSASVKWDFGDNTNSTTKNPSHYFVTAGRFLVKMIAQGHGNCADTAKKVINIKGPQGTFSYKPFTSCGPATINFTASATDNNQFTWDFGDGTTTTTRTSSISHTYPTIGQYVPRLLLQDTTLKCTVPVTGADTVNVSSLKAAIQTYQQVFCDSATVLFADSSKLLYDSASNYLWNFGDGATSKLQNPIHSYTASGNYKVSLSVTTKGGCKDLATGQDIKIVKSPSIRIEGNTSTCVNQPVDFKGVLLIADTSVVSWNWTFENGNTSGTRQPEMQNYITAGTFVVVATATNSSGCQDTALRQIVVNPLPQVAAGEDGATCLGKSIVLKASGAKTYSWQSNPALSCTNCNNPFAKPTGTTTFVVTGTDSVSCKNVDSVTIGVVKPFKLTISPADTICNGETAHLSASGADNYTWSPASGLSNAFIANPVANPVASATYTVIGQDSLKCFTDSAVVSVTFYPSPVFSITSDNLSAPVGNSISINTTSSADVIKYAWTPAAGLSCSDCAQPVATPVTSVTYTAVAANAGGCTAQDQITINVFCNNGNIYVPNTFSPNNDGINDLFYPRGKGVGQIRSFHIFNKYGNVVFYKTNIYINDERSAWDGTYNGRPVESDVYIYKMEVICANGQVIPISGSISVIR